jgi:hypothetical protein
VTETVYGPGPVADELRGAIEGMLADWAPDLEAVQITLNMTKPQWEELLDALHAAVPPPPLDEPKEAS